MKINFWLSKTFQFSNLITFLMTLLYANRVDWILPGVTTVELKIGVTGYQALASIYNGSGMSWKRLIQAQAFTCYSTMVEDPFLPFGSQKVRYNL
jgi:hypothetical protein